MHTKGLAGSQALIVAEACRAKVCGGFAVTTCVKNPKREDDLKDRDAL